MAVGHAIEDIFEISVWLDPIELRRLEQRSDLSLLKISSARID
jgi:hypothetical protein